MLAKLNEKFCKPNLDAKPKCNAMKYNPKIGSSSGFLYFSSTVLVRYIMPLLIYGIMLSPLVGLLSVFYPLSQIMAYWTIFIDYTPTPTTTDYIILFSTLIIAFAYYIYGFYLGGMYQFVPLIASVIMSLLMIFAGSDVVLGLVLFIINIVVTIGTDIFTVKNITQKL